MRSSQMDTKLARSRFRMRLMHRFSAPLAIADVFTRRRYMEYFCNIHCSSWDLPSLFHSRYAVHSLPHIGAQPIGQNEDNVSQKMLSHVCGMGMILSFATLFIVVFTRSSKLFGRKWKRDGQSGKTQAKSGDNQITLLDPAHKHLDFPPNSTNTNSAFDMAPSVGSCMEVKSEAPLNEFGTLGFST